MQIISLTTDLGENNYSLAQLKSSIANSFPNSTTIDVYHSSSIFDIESMAYQILGAIHTMPENSIHVVFCKNTASKAQVHLLQLKNQTIISTNNGLISMIHYLDYQSQIYTIDYQSAIFEYHQYLQNFIQAISIVTSNKISDLPTTISIAQYKPFNSELVLLDDKIITRIIHITSNGNIILNLQKSDFDEYFQNRAFYILFLTVKIFQLSTNYFTTSNSDKIGAIFNETGFLELFMHGDNLAKLFNINKWKGSKIEIYKDNDTNSQINF